MADNSDPDSTFYGDDLRMIYGLPSTALSMLRQSPLATPVATLHPRESAHDLRSTIHVIASIRLILRDTPGHYMNRHNNSQINPREAQATLFSNWPRLATR